MDPYLESPFLWHGFHGFLITEFTQALNAGLPQGLAANAEERVIITPPERAIIPDVHVAVQDRGAVATLERTQTMDLETDHGIIAAYPETEREMFVSIRSVDNWDEIVTIIEVLSPTNKQEGSGGRSAYLAKQQDTLYSSTNLMEIDLLKGGLHTVAAPRAQLAVHGSWDYLIVAHRSAQQWHFEFWLNRLQRSLPRVSVPLLAGMPAFELDLQAAFDRAYDVGPYRRRIDYRKDPPVALDAESLAWVDVWLREKGLR
jgi:hypothetical protein